MINTYGMSINYEKALRSKEKILELIRRVRTKSYEIFSKYLCMIEQTNHESITRIEINENNKSKYLFMAYAHLFMDVSIVNKLY